MHIALQPLLLLYLAFAAKQLVADYFLQTTWMVMGKKAETGWLSPLAAHAGIHAASTLVIALVAVPALWWLALVDLILHATIDRVKAVLSRGLEIADVRFWWAFGIDQTAHQLTHFGFILSLLASIGLAA